MPSFLLFKATVCKVSYIRLRYAVSYSLRLQYAMFLTIKGNNMQSFLFKAKIC
jgi:hypothetical protein